MKITSLTAAALVGAILWSAPAGAYESPMDTYDRQRLALEDAWHLCLETRAQEIDDDRMPVAPLIEEALRQCEPGRAALDRLQREFWESALPDTEAARAIIDDLGAIIDRRAIEELRWAILKARRDRLSDLAAN
jgi:hypothetical protein